MAKRQYFDLSTLSTAQLAALSDKVAKSVKSGKYGISSKDAGNNVPTLLHEAIGHNVAGVLTGLVLVKYDTPVEKKLPDGTVTTIDGKWYGSFKVPGYNVTIVSNIDAELVETLTQSKGQTFPLAIGKLGETVFARLAEGWGINPIAEKSAKFAPKAKTKAKIAAPTLDEEDEDIVGDVAEDDDEF